MAISQILWGPFRFNIPGVCMQMPSSPEISVEMTCHIVIIALHCALEPVLLICLWSS